MPTQPRLRVQTRFAEPDLLIRHTDARHPLAFVRGADGVVGVDEALRFEFQGPERFAEAEATWMELAAAASVDDEVGDVGTGLIAFGTFAFADDSQSTSVLIVPRVVHGKRGDRAWTTKIAIGDKPFAALREPREVEDMRVTLAPGSIEPSDYERMVDEAVARIKAGDIDKIVLARDVVGTLPPGADIRSVLLGLRRRYPDAMTYAVDGLVGASPEMLIAAHGGRFFTRVLAGTAARGATAALDGLVAESLAATPKDVGEHRFAADSAMRALSTLSPDAIASEPYPLQMPNLWHLATDITGSLQGTVLGALAALHPTAAVAGSPTSTALGMIDELESIDRGRYAGPVGWVDAAGDGEWAIALRGGQVGEDARIRAFAGAGIVAESDASAELAETAIKLRPITDAFGDPLPPQPRYE